MALAGITVTRQPLRPADSTILLTPDGQDDAVYDLHDPSPNTVADAILGRLDAIAAARGRGERWFVCGDPVGVAYFVAPPELITRPRSMSETSISANTGSGPTTGGSTCAVTHSRGPR